ncbi:MAG: hypothetical protein ACK5V3_12455 [Bdellovibrionales bacterium]
MYKGLLFSIIVFLSSLAQAQFSFRGDIFAAIENQDVKKNSPINSNNTTLGLPENKQLLEFRPDVSYEFSENQSLTLRSRHILFFEQINFYETKPVKERSELDNDLTDLFISSHWSESLSTTLGLQNYQWGPAEIFSPTNPYYHFNNSQRSFFYKEKGQVLLRANVNIPLDEQNLSVVLLHEPMSNLEQHWTADQGFSEKSVLKFEFQMQNPSNVFALMVGRLDQEKFFVGEYFNWAPSEAVSIYADIQHRQGNSHYTPVGNGLGGFDMEIKGASSQDFSTFMVAGIRWEGSFDFRQEFIWNESGWSKNQWDQSLSSATSVAPNLIQNANRFARPGLEFRTRSYSYTSLRIPDLGNSREISVAIRSLVSLTQDSSATQLNWEYNANDRTVLSAEAVLFGGAKNTEFTLLSEAQISAGLKWSF